MSIHPDPPASGTWIEIDARCLRANLRVLQQEIAPAEVCMVVKGNAYGHGYDSIVPIAEEAGVRRFAVFSAREAAGFLEASDGKSRLMVMGPTEPRNIPWMAHHGYEPWLNHEEDWQHLQDALGERSIGVHLEVETGMNRTGMPPEAALRVAEAIDDHDQVHLEGVCTHLAGREDPANDERVARQRGRFDAFVESLADVGIRPPLRHVASSAAALLDPDSRLDMCRIGIAAYGLWPSSHVYRRASQMGQPLVLRNVLAWKSRVLAVKDVRDGELVGYGTSYEAEGDTRVAVVGVGYADGFSRDLSNRGHVLIGGKRAGIVGAVNMNMVQAHVTHIPEVHVGDEVVLVGRQGERQISVASFSDFNNMVNYELMARLSAEVPRVIVEPDRLLPPLQ